MTPDQLFKRWVHRALIAFVCFFLYFLCADLWMPMTPQARVMHPVISVAPQVDGWVGQVLVTNNQHVDAGDILFRIDSRPYELAVQKAELALEAARQANQQLDASILAARAQLEQSRATKEEQRLEMARVTRLIKTHSISRQQFDQTRASYQGAAATVKANQAALDELKVQRGLPGDDNLGLRQARNALARAKLDLSYTEVRARESGRVTNLQLMSGSYATKSQPLMAVVADHADIIADFREKSLSWVDPGEPASVVFDSRPGKVYDAMLVSRDAGVKKGQQSVDGSLADPEVTDRWVRDAQRIRIHLVLKQEDAPLLNSLPTGARATVQLYPVGGLLAWLGHAQIHLTSLVHYIY